MSAGARTPSGSRRALIVATGKYDDEKLQHLRATKVDAERLAAVLRNEAIGGFEVEVEQDQDEGTITRRIARFFAGARRDDVLLLHVAGHGVNDERNRLYLAARDTALDLLQATAISAEWLNDQMASSRSRRILLLLDCCFSGRFPFNATARAGDDVSVHQRLQGRGIAVITATTATEFAFEGDKLTGDGHESFFTSAVVEGLETGEADLDKDGWISVGDLYEYVYDRVTERSAHQRPSEQRALEGSLFVARSARRRQGGEELRRFEHRGRILALAFSGDGERLAAADSKLARVWDIRSAEEVTRVVVNHGLVRRFCAKTAGVSELAFDSDGRRLLTVGVDGAVRRWDVETGQPADPAVGLQRIIPALATALSEDGRTLAVAGIGPKLALCDLATGEIARIFYRWLPVPLSAIALSPGAELLATAGYLAGVRMWSVDEQRPLSDVKPRSVVHSMALTRDGQRLATAGSDRSARIWDLSENRELARLGHNARVRTVAFSPDGTRLATASDDMLALVWDAGTGEQIHRLTHEQPVRRLAFDASGRHLATAHGDGVVHIWDVG